MKKSIPTIILMMVMLLLGAALFSCGSGEIPEEETEIPRSLEINYSVYGETFRDEQDGSILLEYKIIYPVLKNPKNDSGIAAVNDYYGIQLEKFKNFVYTEGLETARVEKEYAESSGFDYMPHMYERSTAIYYQSSDLLSVLHTQCENIGGARPFSFWFSETFDVKTGNQLELSDILGGSREEALEKVYRIVLSQIQEREDFFFFENYQDELRHAYLEENYLLTENSIWFYYQLYSIAPATEGFPVFELSYEQEEQFALKIPVLPDHEPERELYYQAENLIDRNKAAVYEVFVLSMLPLDIPENHAGEEVLFPVIDERFRSFADLEWFVRSIYAKSEADSLLNSGRYQDIEGKLYGDISRDAGMGYYVNWDEFAYGISDITETSAVLTIYTHEDSPAGLKDITMVVNMVMEDNYWLLEEMFY